MEESTSADRGGETQKRREGGSAKKRCRVKSDLRGKLKRKEGREEGGRMRARKRREGVERLREDSWKAANKEDAELRRDGEMKG